MNLTSFYVVQDLFAPLLSADWHQIVLKSLRVARDNTSVAPAGSPHFWQSFGTNVHRVSLDCTQAAVKVDLCNAAGGVRPGRARSRGTL